METMLTAFTQLVLLVGALALCLWAALLAFAAIGSVAGAASFLLHDAVGLLRTHGPRQATGAAGL